MASPEHSQGGPDREQETLPAYYQAARYEDEQLSGEAYFQAQDAVFAVDFSVSAYRFELNQLWHVAVLGDTPPEEFAHLIDSILATGEPITLPPEILTFLNQRRIQANQLGDWVERHYRPGRRFDG